VQNCKITIYVQLPNSTVETPCVFKFLAKNLFIRLYSYSGMGTTNLPCGWKICLAPLADKLLVAIVVQRFWNFGNVLARVKGREQQSRLLDSVAGVTDWRSSTMQGQVKEEWIQLCERAAVEQDAAKLMELVSEINRILDEKENRLKRQRVKIDPSTLRGQC
jgi:hypothetical protein